ncbi:BGTF surface domain-containing protein [Natrialbaceae archaeon A-arb3/5]
MFLAAIMVLSVVAMSAAFAAPAAAQTVSSVDYDDEVQPGEETTITVNAEDSEEIRIDGDVAGWTVTDTTPSGIATVPDDGQTPYESEDGDVWAHIYSGVDSQEFEVVVEAPDEEGDYDFTAESLAGDDASDTQDFTITVDDDTSSNNDDDGLFDNDRPWQGQDVVASGDLIEAGESYDLRYVDDFDGDNVDSSTFREELTANADGEVVIETDDHDAGDYFLRGGDIEEVRDNAFEIRVQDLDADFDDDSVTDSQPNSDTELELDSVRGEYSVNVSADGDLSDAELFGILVEDAPDDHGYDNYEEMVEDIRDNGDAFDGDLESGATFGAFNVGVYDTDEDDDDADYDEKVVLYEIGDMEEDVDFDGIDDDDYTFDFNVSDTEASASDDITVSESDANANFDQSVYTQTAGDLQEFTIELEDTDDAYIQFGDEDSSFVDIFYIEDDSGNDEVTFTVNTRTLGATGVDHDQVLYSEDDIVVSHLHSDGDTDAAFFDDDDMDPSDQLTGDDAFEQYLDELDLIDADDEDGFDQIVRPLQSTDYDLTVDNNGEFSAEDSESSVDDEIGFATLDLVNPSVDSISTWVGPEESADDEDDLSELQDSLTERENVAIDDQLVIQAEASGIFGYLAAADDGNDLNEVEDGLEGEVLQELLDDDGEGVSLTVEDTVAHGNQDPNELDLTEDTDDVYVLVDNDAGELYVVVDTSDEPFDRSIEDGDEFNVELTYETDSDDRFRFDEDTDNRYWLGGADGDRDDAAFPYFDADSTQSVSTSFTFEDPEATFDNLDDEENVQIENGENTTVTGETNVAPGTGVDIRIQNAGDTASFMENPDAEINSDGSFETDAVDFSDRSEGDEATIDFRVSGSTIDSADAVFTDAPEDPSDDDAADDDAADDDAADDDAADDDAADDDAADDDAADDDAADDDAADDDGEADDGADDDGEADDDDDSVPGFGVAVALVALLAAAMLALRRQD